MRRCPKKLPELTAWEELTWDKIPEGTWASKRAWLSDYIGQKEEVDPETGAKGWMDDEADHRASYDLFSLFDGRVNLENTGEMWPNKVTPITCGVLLVDSDIDELIETVVYSGNGQIMPWIAGGGLGDQPLWWIATMHAVKAGNSRLMTEHRKDMANSAGRDK